MKSATNSPESSNYPQKRQQAPCLGQFQRSQQPEDCAGKNSQQEGRPGQRETRSPEYRGCPHCNSENLKTGAGKKPGLESLRCEDCGDFLGYSPIKRLKRLRKQKNLTDSLDFLESRGISNEIAQVFLLTEVGAIGGAE
jgi:transcription elongation factor Elf1